jgi:NTP pyrophosphatase (non-canonical NTP hydrolase)
MMTEPVAADLDSLTDRLGRFARARKWERFHTPKNLAMALGGEVGELITLFQWLTPEESASVMADRERAAEVLDEIADVFIYLVRLADVLGVDLLDAASRKIDRNEVRFPPTTAVPTSASDATTGVGEDGRTNSPSSWKQA